MKMYLGSCLLITQVLLQCQSYVLLAGNLDDFKTIAKKFVPEQLAEKIAELAANPKTLDETETTTPSESEEDNDNLRAKGNMPVANYDFEELVEKVKERLQQEIIDKVVKEKGKDANHGQNHLNNVVNSNNNKGIDDNGEQADIQEYYGEVYEQEPTKQKVKDRQQFVSKHQKKDKRKPITANKQNINKNKVAKLKKGPIFDTQYVSRESQFERPNMQFMEQNKPAKQNENNNNEEMVYYENDGEAQNENTYVENGGNDSGGAMLTKVEMLAKNDSYEDYVIPAKEPNVFESDSEGRNKKLSLVRLSHVRPIANPKKIYQATTKSLEVREYVVDTDEVHDKTSELKGQTEDLWFDDNQTKASENYADENTSPIIIKKNKTPPMKQGTMIPKRDFYKMSSPNYLARIPVAAEKYDFNEPLPEKDRSPENRKPMPSVPSVINGKVKLK